jgi:hypothetical protein
MKLVFCHQRSLFIVLASCIGYVWNISLSVQFVFLLLSHLSPRHVIFSVTSLLLCVYHSIQVSGFLILQKYSWIHWLRVFLFSFFLENFLKEKTESLRRIISKNIEIMLKTHLYNLYLCLFFSPRKFDGWRYKVLMGWGLVVGILEISVWSELVLISSFR